MNRTWYLSLFGFLLALYVLSMGGHGYGGVGTTTYDVTRSIVLRRSVAISPVPWGKFGRDGQFYAQYGIGHSLYNLPFYLAGHLLTRLIPALRPQYDRLTMFTTLLGQPVIAALTGVLLCACGLQLGYSRRTALICALLYGLGTQAWMYAQLDFSEPLLTCCILAAAWQMMGRSRVNLLWSGMFFGIGVTVKITAVIALPGFLAYLLVRTTERRQRMFDALCFLAPVVLLGGGVVGSYNFLRFGTPFETGYGNEFTQHGIDILRHFGQNLWGLEGGIALYSPVILLAIPAMRPFYRTFRPFALWIVFSTIAAFFLFYPFTTNELYYGPRYLTPTLPFFMLIAGVNFEGERSRRLKFATATLLALGMTQQVVGVVVNYHSYYWRIQYTLPLADAALRSSEIGRILTATPRLPHLLGHLWLIGAGGRDLFSAGGLPLSGVKLLADSGAANAWLPYYGLDLWWSHASLIERAGVFAPLSIVLALLGVMIAAGRRLFLIFNST